MADNKIYITARELSDMLGVSMGWCKKTKNETRF